MSHPPLNEVSYQGDSTQIQEPRFVAPVEGRYEDDNVPYGDSVSVQDALRFRQSLIPSRGGASSVLRTPPLRIATLSPPVGQFVINTILQIAAFAAAIAFGIFAVKSVTVGNDANQFAARALDEAVIANKLAMLAVCLASGNQTDNTRDICSRIMAGAVSVLPSAASNIFTSLPSPTSTTSILAPSSTSVPSTSQSASITTSTITASTVPVSGPAPTPTEMSQADHASSGVIAGAAVGGTVGVLLVVAATYYCVRMRRKSSLQSLAFPPSAAFPSAQCSAPPPCPPHNDNGDATTTNHPHFASDASNASEPDEKSEVRRRVGIKQKLRELFMDSYVVSR